MPAGRPEQARKPEADVVQIASSSEETILAEVRASLLELFDIDPARVTPAARLYEDLELDSIDSVDLIDRVRRAGGKRLAPQEFRQVRTVADLVTVLQRIFNR